jgi:hypothetical protein
MNRLFLRATTERFGSLVVAAVALAAGWSGTAILDRLATLPETLEIGMKENPTALPSPRRPKRNVRGFLAKETLRHDEAR